MRILSLDYDPIFGEHATMSSFGSDISVFDYDVVFWDPASSLRKYIDNYYGGTYLGLPSLTDDNSVRLVADRERRLAEFQEFLQSGRTMVVRGRPPQRCYVATGEVQVSGTGRNARRTRIVSEFDLMRVFPGEIKLTLASGDRIEITGEDAVSTLLRKYKDHLRYRATFQLTAGTPLALVAGTDKVVASLFRNESGGTLAIIPDTDFAPQDQGDGELEATESELDEWPDEAAEFQDELVEVLRSIVGDAAAVRPAWADNYSTDEARQARTAVTKQLASLERARTKLSSLRFGLERVERKDQLYLGTGRALELSVRDALELLGGAVSEPPPGRDDWRVEFDGQTLVVEIKGVSKSAAEKHAAQLEKWVAGSYEETGTMPKGLLIVNTWRDTPLAKRTASDFPKQMLPYSVGRGHCLVTGLELFAITQEVSASKERAAHWRALIVSTSGRLAGVPDWRNYIEESVVRDSAE